MFSLCEEQKRLQEQADILFSKLEETAKLAKASIGNTDIVKAHFRTNTQLNTINESIVATVAMTAKQSKQHLIASIRCLHSNSDSTKEINIRLCADTTLQFTEGSETTHRKRHSEKGWMKPTHTPIS